MSNKPKVVYILPFYEKETDTHFFYNYALIRKLAEDGKVDLYLILEKKKDNPDFGCKCYEQRFSFPPLRFLELLWKCRHLYSQGYRNFYVHYSYYGAIASLFATWRLSRQAEVFYWNRGMPWLFKRNWPEEKIFRFILRNTILVTGPESLAKEYQKRYGVKEYRVLSNWVDIERFKSASLAPTFQNLRPSVSASKNSLSLPRSLSENGERSARPHLEFLSSLPEGTNIVLFLHHLSKRKGADLIPEIAKGFGDDVLFLVAGDGSEQKNLQGLACSNIAVLGKIPNAEVPEYMRMADVFLMPSREEGSPHVLLEAMASGTPFVASDIGGVREIIPAGAETFLCPSEDIKCFRDKIKTLLSNKTLYEGARESGLKHAYNFDISRGVAEFTDLFK